MRFPLLAGLLLSLTTAPGTIQAQDAPAAVNADSVAKELRSQAKGRIKDFYSSRGYWPVWIVDGEISSAADDFLRLIETAGIDDLDPDDYDPEDIRELLDEAKGGDTKMLVRAELKLSREFARYVDDMRAPSEAIRYLDEELRQEKLREDEVLLRAALTGSFSDYVENMGWMNPYYVQLRSALLRHDELSDGPPLVRIPEGALLREGNNGERVRLLRQRLGLSDGEDFDAELADEVRDFQQDHGLDDDGLVGKQTLAALNGPAPENGPLLRLNLERARALPSPWTRHVVVNAASAQLTYYEDGEEAGSMKVVVGTPETPTPMLAGMVRYATLNPYWNVPVDLAQRNIAPAVLKGASLKEMGYEVLSDWSANARLLHPDSVDWQAVADGQQSIRLRKLPSKDNAMGEVKFMFPNDLGIYLHDTPARQLFEHDARQFSNGCVRLEDADRLGEWLFGESLEASSDQPEEHRPLPRPVPVYLTYLTAAPESGTIAYMDDVYGRDLSVEALASR